MHPSKITVARPHVDTCERIERRANPRTGVVDVAITVSVRINGRIVHSLRGPTAREGCERLATHLRARIAAGSAAALPADYPRTRADGWAPRDGEVATPGHSPNDSGALFAVGDWVKLNPDSEYEYEVAEIRRFPHGFMVGIYDDPPSKHLDFCNASSLTLSRTANEKGQPQTPRS